MNLRVLRTVYAGLACALAAFAAMGQVSVTTQHNDNSRTGQNLAETTLNLSNVNSTHFGLLYPLTLDGQVYAQPLVLSNVSINGGTHNVVYIATENDSVYAFDADHGTLYWHVSFINPSGGITAPTTSQIGCGDISPQYGITSTPVIDPVAGTIFVVPNTLENGVYYYRLHALSVSTGAEKSGSPVVIPNYQGLMIPQYQNQRTGLLLTGGKVIFGFSSHCDNNSFNGLVYSYDATSLALKSVYVTAPPPNNSGEAGVWMGGDGIAADASGNIFFASGDGDYDGVTAFGDSIIRLPPTPASGSWNIADWYTPSNNASLDSADLDLGSGGVVLLPDLPSGAAHQHLLAQAGKDGTIVIVDRSNLGHLCCGSGPVQQISGQIPNGMFGSPSYWNGHIYFSGMSDYVKAYSFNLTNGAVSPTPVAESPASYGGSGHLSATTSVSSNGTTNGIVWALDAGSGILHALNATTLAELYNSNQAAGRDTLNGGVKFLAPTIANGKVYVGSNNEAGIYGEFPTDLQYSGGWSGPVPRCPNAGSASVDARQTSVNAITWSFSAIAGAGTVTTYYAISDSAGTLGSGTIDAGSGTVTVNRAPVSAPTVSGSLAILVSNGLGGYNRCRVSYSFPTS